jgi:hypothetical protein
MSARHGTALFVLAVFVLNEDYLLHSFLHSHNVPITPA